MKLVPLGDRVVLKQVEANKNGSRIRKYCYLFQICRNRSKDGWNGLYYCKAGRYPGNH